MGDNTIMGYARPETFRMVVCALGSVFPHGTFNEHYKSFHRPLSS